MSKYVKDYEDLINDLIAISQANGEYTGAWSDRDNNDEIINKFENLMIQKCDEYGIEVKNYNHYKDLYGHPTSLGDERAFALYEELEERIKYLLLRDL